MILIQSIHTWGFAYFVGRHMSSGESMTEGHKRERRAETLLLLEREN